MGGRRMFIWRNKQLWFKKLKNLNEKLINVPRDVDLEVANRKLRFLGKSIDTLTPEQKKYLNSSNIDL